MGNTSVEILDVDALYAGAEHGLCEATASSLQNNRLTMGWLKNNSYAQISKDDEMPMPPAIVAHLISLGRPVPRYLLPPFHPLHIPPHLVAFELLRRGRKKKILNGLSYGKKKPLPYN